MEESNTQNAIRLTDWLILAFVVVVMGLLVFDVGSNVIEIMNRGGESVRVGTNPADVSERTATVR